MGRIRVLPDDVVNKIAAGEVVERPASVVKELLENALDAAAGRIQISIRDGGRALISVLDDGRGMDEADLCAAVQRHATSKLASAEGLNAIQTLGFRGEALASIAAVARVELTSCCDEVAGGLQLVVEGGREVARARTGFPRGTRVSVEALFQQVPARLKFLRATSTELQHIQQQFTQIALGHPGVHFRLTHNQRELHNLAPCASLLERVRQLFGAELAEGLVSFEGVEPTFRIEGLAALPSHARGSRRWQYLFINDRPVRNAGLNHAVYQAYRSLLMKDRHPAYVIKLFLAPGEVDVNVHPAKTEVRLRNARLLHTVLSERLHRTLHEATRRQAFAPRGGRAASDDGAQSRVNEALLVPQAGSGGQLPLTAALVPPPPETVPPAAPPDPGAAAGSAPGCAAPQAAGVPPARAAPQSPLSGAVAGGSGRAAHPLADESFHFQPLNPALAGAAPVRPALLASPVQVLGQFRRTYILAQREDRLVLVDQHAAHERILFETYRTQFFGGRLLTESFLLPPTLELSAQNAVLLEQYLPQWRRMGFELEPFGRHTFVLRQVPAILTGKDVEALILEVLDELALFGKSGRLDEVINEILERVACHAAIRAGMHLGGEEMTALLEQLETLDVHMYCPHGRPVWVEWSARDLEKRFKRIV